MTWKEEIIKMQGKDGRLRDDRISDIKNRKSIMAEKNFRKMIPEVKEMLDNLSNEISSEYVDADFNYFGRILEQKFNSILSKVEEYRDK